jgi:hypothetical protein
LPRPYPFHRPTSGQLAPSAIASLHRYSASLHVLTPPTPLATLYSDPMSKLFSRLHLILKICAFFCVNLRPIFRCHVPIFYPHRLYPHLFRICFQFNSASSLNLVRPSSRHSGSNQPAKPTHPSIFPRTLTNHPPHFRFVSIFFLHPLASHTQTSPPTPRLAAWRGGRGVRSMRFRLQLG